MIPQRTLRNEPGAVEVRERVTECRKRLRQSRLINKPSDGINSSTRLSFLDAEAAVRESLTSSELSSVPSAGASDRFELLSARETRGVGIT